MLRDAWGCVRRYNALAAWYGSWACGFHGLRGQGGSRWIPQMGLGGVRAGAAARSIPRIHTLIESFSSNLYVITGRKRGISFIHS